jgi:serine/threonine protein kinase
MPFQPDYFILLDRLYDTLETRIRRWKLQEKKLSGLRGLLKDPKQSQRKQLWMDRVLFAFDLSSALAYLHSKYVMHRDLKPVCDLFLLVQSALSIVKILSNTNVHLFSS